MSGFVYILKNEKGKLYVGSTDNLERRMVQHSKGYSQTTRNMKMFSLVLAQQYESLNLARKIERKLKNLKRKDYLEKMIDEGYIKVKL